MHEIPPGAVTVADLYRELVAMRADVGKALTRLEVIDGRNGVADQVHRDHETRLRALEAFRWKLAGVLFVVSVLAGILSAWISSGMHH